VLLLAESYGLAAEAYGDALEGCKKTAKKVEEKYVVQMREASVCRLYINHNSLIQSKTLVVHSMSHLCMLLSVVVIFTLSVRLLFDTVIFSWLERASSR